MDECDTADERSSQYLFSTVDVTEKTRKKRDESEAPEERKARLAKERKERLERQRQIEVCGLACCDACPWDRKGSEGVGVAFPWSIAFLSTDPQLIDHKSP